MWTNSTGNSDFVNTHWTMIGQAVHEDPMLGRPALGKLINLYFKSLHDFLVFKKRLSPHDADDLLQGFFQVKLLQGNLLEQASREKGKFRSLLIRALGNYLVDKWRENNARGGAGFEFQDDWDLPQFVQAESIDRFEVEWARQLLQVTLDRMRAECARSGRPDLWQLFEGRLILPVLSGKPEKSYDELQRQFGWHSPKQAADHLTTAKRMFARLLRQVIGEYRSTKEGIDEEVEELDAVLAAAVRAGWSLQNSSLTPAAEDSGSDLRSQNLADETASVSHSLLSIREQTVDHWSPESLQAQLDQQLATSLGDDLPDHCAVDTWLAAAQAALAAQPKIASFADLFEHTQPPLLLLQLVKEFAKDCIAPDPPLLPRQIAEFLYVAALLSAVVRGRKSISSKSATTICSDAKSLLQQSWLSSSAHTLLERLLATPE